MMSLFYVANWSFATGPFNEQFMYGAVALVLALVGAGEYYGLDALIEKAEPKPEEVVHTLPIDRLRPNRFQPRSRFDDAAIEDLAAAIRVWMHTGSPRPL